MPLYLLIAVVTLACAVQALRTKRLLISALWLAGTSALVALLIYLLGAPEVAVIELSVGAGLVTILFVFAINIAGEENFPTTTRIPRWLSWALIILSVGLLAWFILPRVLPAIPTSLEPAFSSTLWNQRGLDMLLQVALIFTGILGVVGLLTNPKIPHAETSGEEK